MQAGTKRPSRGGRPRKFNEDEALGKMQRQLLTTGLSGVSVDGIARSAGLNRPSLAAAFGDKNAIYARAAARYGAMMGERLSRGLEAHDLEVALQSAFEAAIKIYTGEGADGCFVICTAPAEALTNPVCKKILDQSLSAIDALFLQRLAKEAKRSSAQNADLPLLAAQLGAILNSIALRARAGWKRARLQSLSTSAIASVVGAIRGRDEWPQSRSFDRSRRKTRPF
jgi:AcrR family transcriptional regulator